MTSPWPHRYLKRYEPSRSSSTDHELIISVLLPAVLFLAAITPDFVLTLYRCPFRRLTGLPCPTCGMTRATVAFSHGHWQVALQLNPLGTTILFLGVLLTLYVWACRLAGRARFRPDLENPGLLRSLRWISISLFFANWVFLLAVGR